MSNVKKGRVVAFVGTSSIMTENEERDVRQFIGIILNKQYDRDNDLVISGGAKGVDSIAIEIAKSIGFKTETDKYKPEKSTWEYYEKRNLLIANDCDDLVCISIPKHKISCYHHKNQNVKSHEKTAGCWTMQKAVEKGKKCILLVAFER